MAVLLLVHYMAAGWIVNLVQILPVKNAGLPVGKLLICGGQRRCRANQGTKMIRSIAFAALAVVAIAAPSNAYQFQNTSRVAVSYADLDLSRDVGVQILLSRLRTASDVACGSRPDIRDLGRVARYQSCFNTAMDDAVRQTHIPRVAALYGKPELVAQTYPAKNVAVAADYSR
jgi:UrcA family protein